MSISIYKLNDVDINKITYSSPFDIDGKTIIYINYMNKNQLLVQVPSLVSNDPIDNNEIVLPLQAKNNKLTESVNNFFKSLDDKIVNDIRKNAKAWKIKGNIKYRAIVSVMEDSNDKIYENGLIRLKLLDQTDFTTKIYNKKRELLSKNEYIELLNRNCFVKSIIELSSIWFNNDIITLNIRTHQLRITNKIPKIIQVDKYSFSDSEEEEVSDQYIDMTQTDFIEKSTKYKESESDEGKEDKEEDEDDEDNVSDIRSNSSNNDEIDEILNED
ncbi:MAG: hypothetical protein Edafosvirus44_3 [Edafosvirus sp.]|uniref:Uncharacterized protein n=1 Tax=Edafosvirus sp. TaxID=2487765 RepID=A0A3G4ZVF3_9VIRU|nr:MAG: hypothetical protein Edafosvirus44_3 [Edafosvirus sp.]